MDCEAYLMTRSAARVDRDYLVEDSDIRLHGRRDLAAKAAAVHDAPNVEALERRTNTLLGREIEGETATACFRR
jgi:hypothetical protein